jgi:hypothetical protein
MERILIGLCVVTFPEMTEMQIHCIQQYFAQKCSFIIVDNSKTQSTAYEFQQLAKRLGLTYMRCAVNIGPSDNHAACLNVAMKTMATMANDYEYFGILDTDMFPLQPFDLKEYLKGEYNVMSTMQIRGPFQYLWPGFVFWTRETVIHHASWDIVSDSTWKTDSGGGTHYHLMAHPEIRVFDIHFFPIYAREHYIHEILPDWLRAYLVRMEDVSKAFDVAFWHDVVKIGSSIMFFHLRDMSNWKRNSPDFVNQKFREFQSHWPIKQA